MKALLLALAKKKRPADIDEVKSSPDDDLAACYEEYEGAKDSKAKAKALKAFVALARDAD